MRIATPRGIYLILQQMRMGSRCFEALHGTLCNLYFIQHRCALEITSVYDAVHEYEQVHPLGVTPQFRISPLSCAGPQDVG